MLFKTCGVCSSAIEFDVKDNKITNVHFIGGCSGNTQGVARLIEGMDVDEAISRIDGIHCGLPPHFLPGSAGPRFKTVQSQSVTAAWLSILTAII